MPQRLAQHLIARGLLKASTVDEAMRRMAKNGGSLDTNLLEMTVISEAGILQAISDVSSVRLVNLADFEPNPEAGPLMPFKMAKQLGVVPLSVDGIALHLACTYPMPQNQLKDVGFLLGRKLELWVSLEARVKNWQSLVYGEPLDVRVSQLLSALDPPRRISKVVAPKEVTRRAVSSTDSESLSPEVLERIARGIVDEPVLLSSPKKKKEQLPAPAPAPRPLGDELHESKTSVVEANAYSRFAKAASAKLGDGDVVPTLEVPQPALPDEPADTTRLVETAGYESFAKGVSGPTATTAPELTPVGIRFPGGVAPPRRSAPEAASRSSSEASPWVRPAIPSRPQVDRSSSLAPAPAPRVRELPPPPPAPSAPPPVAAIVAPAPPPITAPPRVALELEETIVIDGDAPLLEATVAPELAPDETDFSDVNSQPSMAALAVAVTAPRPVPSISPRAPPQPVAAAPKPVAHSPQPSAPDASASGQGFAHASQDSDFYRAVAPDASDSVPRSSDSSAQKSDFDRAASSPDASASAPQSSDSSAQGPEFYRPAHAPNASAPATRSSDSSAQSRSPRASVSAQGSGSTPVEKGPPPPSIAPAIAPVLAPRPSPQPMASAPSPVPQRSEPWQMMPPASLAPTPTPMAPGVPLAGVQLTAGDPNISLSPPGLGPAGAAEWTLAQARASLKGASQDRELLVSVMLDYGRRTFEYVSAFAVMRGAAYGWEARGDGDLSPIRQLAIPLDAASVFRTVAMTRGSYVGPLPPDALSQHYLALLGRSPRTVFVWPVEVQSRLVAIIYGDCGSRPVSQRRLSDFILFCQELPSAFHDLIVFRKLNPPVMPQYAEPEAYANEGGAELPTDADWFHGLMSLLTGPDPSERSMAMAELLKTPEASAHALAAAFPGPTGWSRLPVVELPEPDELGPIPGALARLGALGATALAPLLDSNDSDTRYLALLTAGSLRYGDVVDGVLRGLFDLEPDISSAARSSAAWLKYLPAFQERMPDLRQELAASDALRRSLAARALGVLHDREAIDGLINLTGSEDELCATSAAEALKEVTRASFGTNPRAWSAWWAGARSKRRIEWLVDALGSDDFGLRLSAIEELSRTFGDNHGFFADGPRDERLAAVERWQEVVMSRPDLEL